MSSVFRIGGAADLLARAVGIARAARPFSPDPSKPIRFRTLQDPCNQELSGCRQSSAGESLRLAAACWSRSLQSRYDLGPQIGFSRFSNSARRIAILL